RMEEVGEHERTLLRDRTFAMPAKDAKRYPLRSKTLLAACGARSSGCGVLARIGLSLPRIGCDRLLRRRRLPWPLANKNRLAAGLVVARGDARHQAVLRAVRARQFGRLGIARHCGRHDATGIVAEYRFVAGPAKTGAAAQHHGRRPA